MKIAVLMTCFNRVETTLICLQRLFKQALPKDCSLEVWLVDDASPDKTGEKVKGVFPQVNVIQSPGNLFWCKGMRLAWDKASESYDYDFYLWLNDDTHLYSMALKTLFEDYQSVPNPNSPHVIVGIFANSEGSSNISYGCQADDGKQIVPNGRPQQSHGVMAGNCVLIPRVVYQEIGPICDCYYHGGGDYDYAMTMHEHGILIYGASRICGWCKENLPKRKISEMSLLERVRSLFSVKGICLHDTLMMRYRHGGMLRAILSFGHVMWIVISGYKRSRSCEETGR